MHWVSASVSINMIFSVTLVQLIYLMVRQMENYEDAMIDLQTKLSFQEDLLESLNQVIINQQAQITKLERTVASMIAQMRSMQTSIQDNRQQQEIPPHY
jgi:SlyX protein